MRLITNLKKWSPRVKNASVALLFLAAYTVSAVAPFITVSPASAIPDQCTTDVQLANDQPGQKDLTQFCKSATNPDGQIVISWNWDETAWPGGNSGDSCALFDTNGDAKIDYAVCVTIMGSPATQTTNSPRVYSCTNNDTDNCTGETLLTNTTTTCTVAQTASDPFGGSGKNRGASYPDDTTATCTIVLADVGGATSVLKDVCSYPSQQPTSDPSDCVITPTQHVPSATIEVVKDLYPAGDTGTFTLSVNGVSRTGGDGATTGAVDVTPGTTYTVQEVGANGTLLTNYTTSVACYDGTTLLPNSGSRTGETSRSISVNPTDGMAVVCTFTNTRQTGTVTLIKSVTNNNGGTLGSNDFGLTVGGIAVTSGQAVTLPAGTPVAINEAGATGYSFVSITGAGCPTALGGMVTPVNGQNITCTITNDDIAPSLTLNKVVVNDNGGTASESSWTLTADGGAAGTFSGSGAAGDTDVVSGATFRAGTYTLSESGGPSGYSASAWTCTGTGTQNGSAITVGIGQTAVCTITNNDQPAALILRKTVVNDNGGTLSASDFPVFIGNTQSSWGEHTVSAGTYNVRETNQAYYTPSAWGGDCSATGSVTLLPGESKTCTITNNDQAASLSGTKFEVNAGATNGTGSTTLAGWTIFLDLNHNGVLDTGEPQTVTDAQGNYNFNELSAGVTYYPVEVLGGSTSGWTQIFSPLPVTPTLGQTSAGNDFGNFRNGSVSGFKFNDLNGQNGRDTGEPGLAGWTIYIDANANKTLDAGETSTATNSNGSYTFANLAPGTYSFCEVAQTNWVQTYPGFNSCQSVTIDISGETNPNINFGNRAQGTLEVKKVVSPANDPGLFDLSIDGSRAASDVGNGGTTGEVTVWAGDHSVGEAAGTNTNMDNYTSRYSCTDGQTGTGTNVDSVTISTGDHVVCTFTNTRQTGTIKVVKEVTNDNGGTAVPADFNLYVNRQKVESGVSNTFNSNVSYTIREDAKEGYEQVGEVSCTVAGVPIAMPFTLQANQNVVCTIKNDDVAPKLVVKKVVDNGITNLTKEASDFTMSVTGKDVSDTEFAGSTAGTTVELDAGSYSVSEGGHTGYTMTASTDCTGTITIGQTKTCTITNTAIVVPGITVEKTGPATAHEGDTVTYTFTVKNTGNVSFPSGTVLDDVASPDGKNITQVEGDDVLDPGETFVFTVDYTIPTGTDAVHNTVTVCGQYGSDKSLKKTCSSDDHTLTVVHPAIAVVKTGPANAQIGTIGTYTFTVTNTGDVPLTMGDVVDDVAGLGAYVSGDTNENGQLDLTETWVFQAKLLFTQNGPVVNTVKACGSDELDKEVCTTDSHTTLVYTPQVLGEVTPPAKQLENTGNSIWTAILMSLTVLGLSTLTLLSRRREQHQTA